MIAAYRWESNWKIAVLVIVIVPVLLRLGFWQLQRADEKIQLQSVYDQQQALPAVSFDQLIEQHSSRKVPSASGIDPGLPDALASRRVLLSGQFEQQKTILLDNQIVGGRVGYDVITPFVSSGGSVVLLNRGWIEGFADRRQLPSIVAVNGEVNIEASIYIPAGKSVLLAKDHWPASWPLVVQWLDVSRVAERLEQDLFPYVLRIEEGQPGVLQRHWQAINTQPEKHWGYAVQWFLMATALTLFWLYSSIKTK